MAIIIPSKNIYNMNNNKIIDNKITGISIEIDDVNSERKSYSQTIKVFDENGTLNNIATIKQKNSDTTDLYAVIDIDIISDFTIEGNITSIVLEDIIKNNTIRVFDYVEYVNKPLVDYDPLLVWKFLLYEERVERNHRILHFYFNIGNRFSDSYTKSITISFNYSAKKINKENKLYGYDYIKLNSNELLKSSTWFINNEQNVENKGKLFNYITLYKDGAKLWVESLYNVTSNVAITISQLLGKNYDVTITNGTKKSNEVNGSAILITNISNIIPKYDTVYVYDKDYKYSFSYIDTSEHLANETTKSYKNGKETATIRCSINDYYNEDTSIAKSITDTTKDMTFIIGDKIIPMVNTPNGDIPMSRNKDNTAKVFNVLGNKIYFNGAVWQELTLQEI